MLETWLAALEGSALASALRNSVWVYPLVNAGHILGVALLVGAIFPLDLRLLGIWRSVALGPLWRMLSRTAAFGLALAILFGSLLFITRATEYAASPLFITKMLVIAAGITNALALNKIALQGALPEQISTSRRLPLIYRLAAGLSITVWLTALTLGRLVGYF